MNQQYVDAAREYLETKFHHQGRLKGVGIDCAGLLVCAAKDINMPSVPDIKGYRRSPDGKTLRKILEDYLTPVSLDALEPGDILLFHFDGVQPQHVAIVTTTEPLYMIHAYSVCRKVTEHAIDEMWLQRLVAAYRLPEGE